MKHCSHFQNNKPCVSYKCATFVLFKIHNGVFMLQCCLSAIIMVALRTMFLQILQLRQLYRESSYDCVSDRRSMKLLIQR